MIDLFLGACDLLRPILFFVLLAYAPMKFGIGFDVAGKPPSAAEIRNARALQLQRIAKIGLFSIFLVPVRLLAVAYFTIWLLVDKTPWLIVALFVLSLLPLYFG
ncbi:hypothetical protein [Comamonas kerstersii]|uniref:Uncharacterized protein n=1 Tax=Comamonas kerstersii TaxID=225992 RepID=A0A0W7Z305_9BURK|nr:hypothetical protein [Comamonas kerstersii]KUF41604.1 hypothetical protein AS359_08480 [Comamonas kerstersii]QTW17768.1 hypothetical protein H8N02_10915 [Comamonas kerstersii]